MTLNLELSLLWYMCICSLMSSEIVVVKMSWLALQRERVSRFAWIYNSSAEAPGSPQISAHIFLIKDAWEGSVPCSQQDRPSSWAPVIQLISSDFLQAHCSTRKTLTVIFSPHFLPFNRKASRYITNACILAMWNEFKIKNRKLLMMCVCSDSKVTFEVFLSHCQLSY